MTRNAEERFRRDYAPAFLQYLSEGGERGRRAAYELGRRAIGEQLSVLDLARIHHGMLLDVLKTHRSPQELEHIAQAASEFLVEALAVFEMTQRGFTELLSTLRSDQHHAQDIQAELERQQALERATGMLMERHGLSADTAAEQVRQTAARQGITGRPAPIGTIACIGCAGRTSCQRATASEQMTDGSGGPPVGGLPSVGLVHVGRHAVALIRFGHVRPWSGERRRPWQAAGSLPARRGC
jgi:hypothetical protein